MPTKAQLLEDAEKDKRELNRMDREIQSLKEILADIITQNRPDTSKNLRII